jgi:hypothetical protein
MQLLKLFPSKLFSVLVLTLWAANALASVDAASLLRTRYKALLPTLEKNVFNAPLHIESEDSQGRIRGAVYGVLEHGFDALRTMVTSSSEWCELLLMHPNLKYCAYRASASGETLLTLYTGGKHYTAVEDARQNEYRVHVTEAGHDYLVANVSAEHGPLDTSDYHLVLEAVPIDANTTFVHVDFSYRYGAMTRALTATYFSTFGRNKIGFSIVGRGTNGEPVFVRGRTASLERTVMRTYIALQAWLEGKDKPEKDRFEWRLRRWYYLTERYPKQLYEFDQQEYLDVKLRERANRLPGQSEAAIPSKG